MIQTLTINGEDFRIFSAGDCAVDFPRETEKRSRKFSYYVSDFGTFDIETTSVLIEQDERGRFKQGYGFMYIWQFYSKTTGLVMGRYWDDFIVLLNRISESLKPPRLTYFVIYVHNLPFEFAFAYDQLARAGITGDVFAVKSRKPVTWRLNIGIEFRCSLKLTNRGLAKYLKDMPAGFEKLVGDLDYRKRRTPKSVLTETELSYCAVDVIGLWRSLKLDMQTTHDTIATIPLTLTGYVRREFRDAIKYDKKYKYLLSRSALNVEQFEIVRALAKGGDTLAAASQILGVVFRDVGSADFKSSYPCQLLTKRYPMGKLEYEGRGGDIDVNVLRDIENAGRYFITQFYVRGLRLKDKCCPIPCVTMSTTYFCRGALYYNGRVLKADELGIAQDMISFRIFCRQYEWDSIDFGYTYSCDYNYLPETVRNVIYHYFELKCHLEDKLKKLEKNSPEYDNTRIDYNLAKSRLNSIFGMFYTAPLHSVNEFDCGWCDEYEPPLTMDEAKSLSMRNLKKRSIAQLEELVENNRKKLFVNQCSGAGEYLWGVHTAALGREALDELITATGKFNVIYSDTDSVKFRYTPDALSGIAKLNEKLKSVAIEHNAYVNTGENVYYLGIAEDETREERYQEFITLGAKKYCYRDSQGLHITISGVQKQAVDQLHDDITEFHMGKIFNPAGGIMLHYIDAPVQTIHVVGDDGTEDDIELGNNIFCEERIITLGGITDDRFGDDLAVFEELFNTLPDEND